MPVRFYRPMNPRRQSPTMLVISAPFPIRGALAINLRYDVPRIHIMPANYIVRLDIIPLRGRELDPVPVNDPPTFHGHVGLQSCTVLDEVEIDVGCPVNVPLQRERSARPWAWFMYHVSDRVSVRAEFSGFLIFKGDRAIISPLKPVFELVL
ncbi:hypothetical protein BDP55DRAFT_637936 [Colletotrichum godetiae]|uniref:Uncharacterized protein n=1 Tax=Colletotrichum godetiae TaxID=1209918 RepID=A0AAJ0EN84_9PEZI|nr:uncharacterized protein BDP55DRAFT_637936 [Colletotrichum godetiae]KAK1658306.1 hypothetical protein BDP55DRAFT_637936 [Colletotrichum godetiae]